MRCVRWAVLCCAVSPQNIDATLASLGLSENTLILFTGEHCPRARHSWSSIPHTNASSATVMCVLCDVTC
jgi:hypothetical protein